MTDNPKARWPKMPGGTIDWEKVFEDGESGLIPLIMQAQSASALRESTIVVITQLYTRKDDPPEVERFVGQLTAMIPDAVPAQHLPRIAEAVVGILRQIKADRIRKALEFEAAKAAAESKTASAVVMTGGGSTAAGGAASTTVPADNRRSTREQPKLSALAKAAARKKRKMIILITGGIASVLILAGVGTAVYVAGAPRREMERKANLLVSQIEAVGRGETVGTHVYGGNIRADKVGDHPAVVVEGLTPDQCASAGWVFANKGNIMINGFMPTKVSPPTLSALCSSNPDNAILTWVPRPEGRKGSKAKK